MKVAKWKVLSLAGVLALGYVATSEAAQIKVSDDTWANFGLNMKVMYTNEGKRLDSGDWNKNVFDVKDTKVYFVGQVNKLWQFYAEWDSAAVTQGSAVKLTEGGINLALAKEFQVLAGLIHKPFTRANISSGYALLIPTGYYFNPIKDVAKVETFFKVDDPDGGLVLHGDLGGGVLTYRVGVFNQKDRVNYYKGLEYAARVEFQPLMLGFKPESAATTNIKIADTYLGAKDIFTIGLGYRNAKAPIAGKDKTQDGWTIDATLEKKFGNLVPNLQLGYVTLDNTHKDALTTKGRDSKGWYVQGQLLYDQVVGLGKPALAIRFDTTENDKKINIGGEAKDAKLDRWGVAFNYYIKGQAARVSLGFDTAKYKSGSKDLIDPTRKTSVTDWYLYLQSQF